MWSLTDFTIINKRETKGSVLVFAGNSVGILVQWKACRTGVSQQTFRQIPGEMQHKSVSGKKSSFSKIT